MKIKYSTALDFLKRISPFHRNMSQTAVANTVGTLYNSMGALKRFGRLAQGRPVLPKIQQDFGSGNLSINIRNQLKYDPTIVTPGNLAHQLGHLFDRAARKYPPRFAFDPITKDIINVQRRASALGLQAMKRSGIFSQQQIKQAHNELLKALKSYHSAMREQKLERVLKNIALLNWSEVFKPR